MVRYRDRLGKPVPSRLNIVWRGRENLDKMRSNLRQWRGALAAAMAGAISPQSMRTFSAFQGVPIDEISELVERIDNLLGATMPQIACRCKERYCPFCEGKGWLNACDARRISNQEQLPTLSAFWNQRQSSLAGKQYAAQNSESKMLRLLWLLAGPPDANLPAPDLEIASSSADALCSTTT